MFERNDPLPKNDDRLFVPTKCRVLKSFCVGGKPLDVGSTITLPWHEVEGLLALGRAELLI